MRENERKAADMRKLNYLIVVIPLIFCGIIGCTAGNDITNTTKAHGDPDQIINVSRNEHFFLTLPSERRDEGYRWGAYFDGTMLSLIKATYQKNYDNRTDAGSTEWFEFKAVKAGECEIRLVYMHWLDEGSTKPIDEKSFNINIK